MIQNLGQLKRTLTMNTSQVEELAKAVIEVKALGNRLSEVLKMREELGGEIADLKILTRALAQKISGTRPTPEISSPSMTKSLASATTPQDVMQYLQNVLAKETRGDQIFEEFQKAKEEIFKMTGGHRILREIADAARTLKGKEEITDIEKINLRDKVKGWSSSL
ncbi:MAG: hypothetical protein RBG13Loki_0003 [Promethearchaeota archaeon CR_4]|nr:MAG: hypothetical protein RBG13Loki_0003 [Candidatus Lokiarchaeota archaeon CR_4]